MSPERYGEAGRTAERGFSLLEVLIALLIVGLMLGATATVFGNGLRGHTVAGDVDTALGVAEAKLDAAGITERLRPGASDGVFADRFHWRMATTGYDDPNESEHATALDPLPSYRLFRVAVTVAWQDGPRQRQVALAGLRMAPTQP